MVNGPIGIDRPFTVIAPVVAGAIGKFFKIFVTDGSAAIPCKVDKPAAVGRVMFVGDPDP